MRFLVKVCALFFVCGLLSMLLGTADQLFDLGLWHGAYPPIQTDANGVQTASTYGEFMLYAGGTTLFALLLGSYLWYRLQRRYEAAVLFMEAVRAQGYEEAREEAPEDEELFS
jgi:hypothetical protein